MCNDTTVNILRGLVESIPVSNNTTPAPAPFTRWHREMDGPLLVLVVERDDGSLAEWLELDVRELPERQDLLGRLGETARNRLLRDAAYTAEIAVGGAA